MYGNPMYPYTQQAGLPGSLSTGFQQMPIPAQFSGYAGPMQQMPVKPQEFDWIRVNNLEDVKNVSVQPGGKAWIMLQNDPVFVVKTADAMGLATTQAFKFEPYNPQQPAPEQYAPLAIVQQMQTQIQQLTDELNALRGGATRGKPVKQPVSAGTATGAE